MVNHKVQAQALKNAIDASKRVLVVSHRKPDADTLGSSCAWIHLLRSKGKYVTAFCTDEIPGSLQHIPGVHEFTADETVFDEPFDVIIMNDAASLDYAGIDKIISRVDRTRTTLVNIDHHATNPHFGDINLVIPDASSTTEVLTRLFRHWGETITKPMAESLMNGLVTDTDKLMNPATYYNSFAIASHLIQAGADLYDIIEKTLRRKSVTELRIWGLALSRLKRNQTYNSVATYITERDLAEYDVDHEAIEGIVNYLTLITDVDVIMFLRVHNDSTIKGSLRSVKPHVDVSKLAIRFGGGGHRKAAGFTIRGTFLAHESGWTIS